MNYNPYLNIPSNQLTSLSDMSNINSVSLGLKQINGFEMVKSFDDGAGYTWKLVKSATDSGVEIPDPSLLQVTDYWCHEFPGSCGKVYIYVVEGIKQPRTENEKPVSILYQWFSTYNNPHFNPQIISKSEWLNANVYASEVRSSRITKLNALCKTNDNRNDTQSDTIDISLIKGCGNDDRRRTRHDVKSDKVQYIGTDKAESQ